MSNQDYFNIALSIIGFISTTGIGWVISKFTSLSDSIVEIRISIAEKYVNKVDLDSELKQINQKLDQLSDMERNLGNDYVKKSDLKDLAASLEKKLDSIEAKLDRKQDKERR